VVDGELWPFAVGGVGCLHCVVDLVGESHGDCNVMRCLFFGLCASLSVPCDCREERACTAPLTTHLHIRARDHIS